HFRTYGNQPAHPRGHIGSGCGQPRGHRLYSAGSWLAVRCDPAAPIRCIERPSGQGTRCMPGRSERIGDAAAPVSFRRGNPAIRQWRIETRTIAG
ncbi:MAG: hypothetical protein D6725_08065, partial [Planctomycetota bacterium]